MTSFSIGDANEQERKHRTELFAQLQMLGEISSSETALFHQAAAAKYGLGITDMKALGALMQEGPMTAGQIAKRLSLPSGAVTSLIDRLERRNFVQRAPDPTDRRKVVVIPNLETLASGENVYLSMGEAFNRLYETYSTEQLEFLVRYLKASIELNKQEIAKLARKEQILPDDA
jgi:DNA-binding MarR family transcriptional regulator